MDTFIRSGRGSKIGLAIFISALLMIQWINSGSTVVVNDPWKEQVQELGFRKGSNPVSFLHSQPTKRNASNKTINAARELVASAIQQMRVSNKAQVQNPSRNIYTLKTSISSKRRRDGLTPFVVNSTVAAAAALVAEIDAQEKAANGTLVTSYPNIEAIRNRGNTGQQKRDSTTSWWMEGLSHLGTQPFGGNSSYRVWRDVSASPYNAKGNGIDVRYPRPETSPSEELALNDIMQDDTAAINAAIADGNRCGEGCESSSTTGALVYFPGGTYLVSGSIIAYYNTQLVGNPNDIPTIKASGSFVGLGVISTDVYVPNGGTGSDGLAKEWYINTSNFYRQIRNFNIDISDTDQGAYVAAIHYQVAQATSLYNVAFISTVSSSTTQQGLYAENGSGGFMSNLIFTGGAFGIWGGNQQFTASGLVFQNVGTGIQTIWDWGWTWKNIEFDGCGIGINLLNQADQGPGAASVVFQDSIFSDTTTGIIIGEPTTNWAEDTSVLLDNVVFSGVTDAVKDLNNNVYLTGGIGAVEGWVLGKAYFYSNTEVFSEGTFFGTNRNPALTGTGNPLISGYSLLIKAPFLDQPKPQYNDVPVSGFVQMKNYARGDGITVDTTAFQNAINEHAGSSIIFIDAGSYILDNTILIPSGAKIVGECWAQLVASGANFQDQANPRPLLRVGNPGDTGSVEIQDLLFTSVGPTAGLIAVEWNLNAASQGSAAMWDCHVRLGGATGTDLQVAQCPASQTTPNEECIAGSLMLHLTSDASAYFENVWLWTADHDIDDATNTQVSVFVGRGILIESKNPVWLYATAVEHATLYQYTFLEAQNVVSGMIQTESPYYQPNPAPPSPFQTSIGLFNGDDQTLFDCSSGTAGCDASWGLRIIESSWIQISGAGLYAWFDNYVQEPCVDNQDCQIAQVQIQNPNGNVWIFNLITIGATSMVTEIGEFGALQVLAGNNTNTPAHPYWAMLSVYQPASVPNDGAGEDSENNVYVPPDIWSSANPTVNCFPPCTLILPPFSMGITTTIQWPNLTTTLMSSSGGQIYTITTTISVPPFTTDVIEWWAVTVYVTDTTGETFTPVQSVMPPSFTITLPAGVQTFPPSQFPTIDGGYTVNPSSTSSAIPVGLPLFFSTPHPVTIQQQPTWSMPTPPPTPPPTVTYSSGQPSSTCTTNCGTQDCGLFGCDHGCGIFGCDGGCGIWGCGGGCGILGCPSICDLYDCGGLNCIYGECGDDGCPNGDCDEENSSTSCETTQTETNCIDWATVTTNDEETITSVTSTSCFPTSGCEITATTTTVTTATNSAYACPVVTADQPLVTDFDIFGGCQPCAYHYIPWDTTDDLDSWAEDPETDADGAPDIWPDTDVLKRKRRRNQGNFYDPMPTPPPIYPVDKRATPGGPVDIVGLCPVPEESGVTVPFWTRGPPWLASAIAGNVAGTQTDMPRWYATTVEAACSARITVVPDVELPAGFQPTVDHTWEIGWLDDFFRVLFGSATSPGVFSCDQMNQIFFTAGCTENRLKAIYNALPSEANWDFVGMARASNRLKAALAKGEIPSQVTRIRNTVAMRLADGWEDIPGRDLRNPQYWGKRRKFGYKVDSLWNMILGCSLVTDAAIFGLMDRANNRIWNEFRATDQYVSDNQATLGYTTNFGDQFQTFMNDKVRLLTDARTAMDLLVTQADGDLTIIDNPIVTDEDQRSILDQMRAKYNYLKQTYNIDLGNPNHVCAQPGFQFTWREDEIEGSPPGCCGGCCVILKRDGELVKRQDNTCSSPGLDTAAPTNPPTGTGGSGGGGESPTSTTGGGGGAASSTIVVPPPASPTAQLIIGWDQEEYEDAVSGYSQWWFYTPPIGQDYNVCDSIGTLDADPSISASDIPFPDGTFDLPFEILGNSGCAYVGTTNAPGIFKCPDLLHWIQCTSDVSGYATCYNEQGTDTVYAKVNCEWD